MKHGSLFSGIGGFDLAAEWMGWENVFHCEWNSFGQKILNYYWPNAKSYGDITKTDFTEWRGKVDIVSGGFPCQPYSTAGKRKGKADDRHLWPEMLRAIREIQPSWIVGENVPGLLNWERGMVLAEIKADLESAGFEVLPPCILPAISKNASHKRDRLWIIAHSNSKRSSGLQCEVGEFEKDRQRQQDNETNNKHITSDTMRIGQQGQGRPERQGNSTPGNNWQEYRAFNDGGWPSESLVCRGNDGLSKELDGTTFRKWATESIKGYGNSVVPQVVYEIFKAIEECEKNNLDL